MRKFFVAFVSAVLAALPQVSGSLSRRSYRGAVVEYHPVRGTDQEKVMIQNANNYAKFMTLARAKGADIIVFPELGLASKILSPIPDPMDKTSPCETNTTEAVKILSCASRDAGIYSVVNLLEKRKCETGDKNCPPAGFYRLNTNVVFDRRGVVIARYAKYNVYMQEGDRPTDPDFTFFDTDFGVRFGTFVCFDILYYVPAQRLVEKFGIKDFVFTTEWFSELPFLTALQAQRGWAEANNVNLLASGINNPSVGSSGSGIYNGKLGPLVEILPETTMSKLLIADIPKTNVDACTNACQEGNSAGYSSLQISLDSDDVVANPSDRGEVGLLLIKEELENYTSEVITPGIKFEERICSGKGFCCDFRVDVKALREESSNYTLRALVFAGVRAFGKIHFAGVETCSVVACNGPHVSNCTERVQKIPGVFRFREINIKGKFTPENALQMPTTLTDGKTFAPLGAYKYEFSRTEEEDAAEVTLNLRLPETSLYVFGIWGRDFSNDGLPEQSGAPGVVSLPALLAALFGFMLFVR